MDLLFIIIILIILYLEFKPSLDYTKDKKLLLWYGRKNRKYLILMQ